MLYLILYSVCIRSRSHQSKESQRSRHRRSHHRPRHRSRTRSRTRSRSRSASASDRHKHSRRSSHHRSSSTTHEHSPPDETSNKHHTTSRNHKKKKTKRKSSKTHQTHLTRTSTDTSPSVEASSLQPASERRLVTLSTMQQQQQQRVLNDAVDKTVDHDSESSDEDQCLDKDGSKLQQHSPLHQNLSTVMLGTVHNKECYSKHNGS